MRILYLTNIPSPYMVDFLNELGKRSQLTVVFERAGSGVRDKSWNDFHFDNFTGIILKGKNIRVTEDLDDQAICPQIVRYIRKRYYDAIVVANPCTPTGIIAIMYMKLMRIPYAIQSEGGFPKDGKGGKEKIKKIIMGHASLYFSTAPLGDAYFVQYGADKNKIRRYPFTSLYQSEIRNELVSVDEKMQIKQKLAISYQRVVISVGRFIDVKGFDVFIEACANIDDNVGVYIIGGEPTEYYQELKRKYRMDNLHFVGHVNKETMKEYYCAADIFVLNSRGDTWGLVINEAMSFGLPVISSDKCFAALALIEDGKCGYIVPVDDTIAFRNRIMSLLKNDSLRHKMGSASLKKMQGYTLEEMGRREIEILEGYLNGEV